MSEHQACCKILFYGLTYDQLNIPFLASMELVARRLQMVEIKWRDRFLRLGHAASSDVYDDMHLYEGASGTRGVLVIAPELEAFVGTELAREALAAKERRKAMEERALNRKNAKQTKKGQKDEKDG